MIRLQERSVSARQLESLKLRRELSSDGALPHYPQAAEPKQEKNASPDRIRRRGYQSYSWRASRFPRFSAKTNIRESVRYCGAARRAAHGFARYTARVNPASGKRLIAMVHVRALPGTPRAAATVTEVCDIARREAHQLIDAGFDAILIENMHDAPYLSGAVGPEIVAAMTAVGCAIRRDIKAPLGVQVLAAANREALAVALACGADFVRVENFAFAHVADEGLMPTAAAGPLLRYRRQIGAEHVRIFADVKKKHSSHAITADIDLAEAARAAEFFGADGVIVTGSATGRAVDPDDIAAARSAVDLPIWLGSGVSAGNVGDLWAAADGF
ncbi:MAG: hypothetical protein D6744_14740, partial [Planctomycetota bacterium]